MAVAYIFQRSRGRWQACNYTVNCSSSSWFFYGVFFWTMVLTHCTSLHEATAQLVSFALREPVQEEVPCSYTLLSRCIIIVRWDGQTWWSMFPPRWSCDANQHVWIVIVQCVAMTMIMWCGSACFDCDRKILYVFKRWIVTLSAGGCESRKQIIHVHI